MGGPDAAVPVVARVPKPPSKLGGITPGAAGRTSHLEPASQMSICVSIY